MQLGVSIRGASIRCLRDWCKDDTPRGCRQLASESEDISKAVAKKPDVGRNTGVPQIVSQLQKYKQQQQPLELFPGLEILAYRGMVHERSKSETYRARVHDESHLKHAQARHYRRDPDRPIGRPKP